MNTVYGRFFVKKKVSRKNIIMNYKLLTKKYFIDIMGIVNF